MPAFCCLRVPEGPGRSRRRRVGRRGPRGRLSGDGAATGCSSLGMWFANSGDHAAQLGPGGDRDLGSRALQAWTGSGGQGREGQRRPRGGTQCWKSLDAGRPGSEEREKFPGCSPLARVGPWMPFAPVGGLAASPTPLSGLAPPWGSRLTSGASRGVTPGARAAAAAPAAGLERRGAPPQAAGRRARPPVSSSESPGWAAFIWPCRVHEAEAGQGASGVLAAHKRMGVEVQRRGHAVQGGLGKCPRVVSKVQDWFKIP